MRGFIAIERDCSLISVFVLDLFNSFATAICLCQLLSTLSNAHRKHNKKENNFFFLFFSIKIYYRIKNQNEIKIQPNIKELQ